MAKTRDKSHILTIEPDKVSDKSITTDTAIEALLDQRDRLKDLIVQIEGDLESLGYKDESKT
jgi:hypothetical protein